MSGSDSGEVLREVKIAATGQLQWSQKKIKNKKKKTLFNKRKNKTLFLYKFTIFVVRVNKKTILFYDLIHHIIFKDELVVLENY
jgi:hypothetical protein